MIKILIFSLFMCLNLSAAEPTLRAMVAQMVMVGFNGSSLNETSVKVMISDAGYSRFGGVMLLGRNIKDKAGLKALTLAIKNKAPNLFIAIDEEGGKVSRLGGLGVKFISAKEVGETLDIKQAHELYLKMGKILKELGINMNFAPVVDLHSDASPIIGKKERAFSANGAKVSLYANTFIDAMGANGIISVMKHFPGHGNSESDSHKDKSVVKLTRDALLPYRDAISQGRALAIMSGHLYVSNLDDKNPATLSHITINSLLRTELGFGGVVISDDMLMKGVGTEPLKEKIFKFINAGGDILLFSEFNLDGRKSAELVKQHIIDLVNEKRISKERIETSYKRIMSLKKLIK
ncbi:MULTISPECIES: glycoside hydrolase family 3 N-terminal domain-containing protein [unclassified Campylobacter]|uniref:glycoside hydrolase family 3 N-terminal domain-containing protein n=1 Tax=unclassified Campylobacter TaxID=2593542 RepID=UPI003D359488